MVEMTEQPYNFSSSTVKHPRVRWQVIEYLLNQVLSQSLKSGDALPMTNDICETLGVSRTAVREAISILVSKGMVISRAGGGSFVQPLSNWMLLDPEVLRWLRESDMAVSIVEHLLEIRLIIEPEAAALAAIRGSMEQFMIMSEAMDRMAAGTDKRSPESIRGDVDFHNSILDTSGNIFLARMRDLCMVSVELIIRLTFGKVDSVTESVANHIQLLDAIRARSPRQAYLASRKVLSRTLYDLKALNIPFRRDIIEHFEVDRSRQLPEEKENTYRKIG